MEFARDVCVEADADAVEGTAPAHAAETMRPAKAARVRVSKLLGVPEESRR